VTNLYRVYLLNTTSGVRRIVDVKAGVSADAKKAAREEYPDNPPWHITQARLIARGVEE